MRIVRPYGSSRSKPDQNGLRRFLVEKNPERTEREVPEFARSHDELVIAQWISMIDKIARKPMGQKKPSPLQRAFRHKLGNVCWLRLIEGGHLPGASGENRPFLADLWWFKIHPYGPGEEEPRPLREGSRPASPKIEGRWYQVFAGDCAPDKADARKLAEIAERIEKHLYHLEYRLGQNTKPRSKGKIDARAASISSNVLANPEFRDPKVGATAADIGAYKKPGDPVSAIYKAAGELEKRRRVSLALPAKILFEHWGKVFREADGDRPMNVNEVREKHSGMFALHMTLKQCYGRLLKRTRRDTPEHRKQAPTGRRLSQLLPRNLDQALRLSDRQASNVELGALVRLGKIVHYAASEGNADRPQAIRDNWPANTDNSRFWTSDGQSGIKRAEAFVRIWRQTLVLAGLTLNDWVSMRAGFEGDILGGRNKLEEALQPGRFERAHFERKLHLLFGNRASSFTLSTDTACLELLRRLIDAAANLRHAVFHFKGRGALLDELANLPARFPALIRESAQQIWRADAVDRTARLKAVLRAADVERFLRADQLTQAFELLRVSAPAELPLPRFSRVLQRAEGAWVDDKRIRLPEPANRRSLQDPARLCQYTVLKLVYERPFRSWLRSQRADMISGWIDDAVGRATEAARRMNAKGDETGRKVIAARARDLPKPSAGSDIIDFFFDLSAETASEMRVQRGYESDGEKAREQAEYIDHLLRDVVILSFSQFLSEQKLDWLLDLRPDQAASDQPGVLDDLQSAAPVPDAEEWVTALYLLLHLVPVESVGRLLHQLAKWNVTASRASGLPRDEEIRLQRLGDTMTLYLDMHDAKFEGDSALGQHDLQDLFESVTLLDRVFPKDPGPEVDQRIPKRGLREIMRFGHIPLLRRLAGDRKIDTDTVERVFAAEESLDGGPSQIARWQQRREQLHEQWVKEKQLDETRLREYCEILSRISRHRQDSNFVNLVDHVRAHRLVMAVLGRLVDYAGLFERDLYFTTLALLYRKGLRPEHLLEERGLRFLFRGQIIFALREHKGSPQALDILDELAKHFTRVWATGNSNAGIRNSLAHLNMLQGASPAPRLSHWVNQTRQLLAHDRKLKNAVSKSVIELLAREGMELRWTMKIDGTAHELAEGGLSARCARHLGGKRLILANTGPRPATVFVDESLHSDGYVAMIATAFEGRRQQAISIEQNLPRIDWKASAESKGVRQGSSDARPKRPSLLEKQGSAPRRPADPATSMQRRPRD
jgi:hypothetical protein